MKSKRIKITNPIQTREQMEREVGEIARLKIQESGLKSEMDEKLNRIRKEYEERLVGVGEAIAGKMVMVEAWADENLEEFGKLKSIETLHATLGWRIGNPTVKTLKGWTWAKVLESLIRKPSLAKYVRLGQPTVNKDAILTDRKDISADLLLCNGMKIEQSETFYVEPNLTEVEAREVSAA